MSALPAPPHGAHATLDGRQHALLLQRFEDAIASLREETDGEVTDLFRRHESDRSLRIATNMRGHIR